MLKYIIRMPPVTKKNHQQICIDPRTGKRFVRPSTVYTRYENAAVQCLIPKPDKPLAGRYCVTCLYYMPTLRRVDLSNLLECTHDVLVTAGILEDDNSRIIASVDGSRVLLDRQNPRTEIFIEEMEKDETE